MLSIFIQTPPVTWWCDSAVWRNALSQTMSSLVSSSIKLLFRGLNIPLKGRISFARICAGAVIQEYYKSLEGCEFGNNPQRCRCKVQECVSHFIVFHTAVFPLFPLRLMPRPVIAWTIHSSSELIYYLIHFMGEPVTPRTTTSVSTVWEEYSEIPRLHSVWFFQIEQRGTDMAIATDVDGDAPCL